MNLQEKTLGGLHDYLLERVLPRYAVPGGRAIDLGAGTGALAVRLGEQGWNVLAVDNNQTDFGAPLPFVAIDLDDADFPSRVPEADFDLVTAVEVIEHMEAPIQFLRSVVRLLKPTGVAVLTTPNVDNAAARVKFLLKDELRMMDRASDATHISPIFWDLFTRQYLPRARLQLVEHCLYPPRGFQVTRARYAWALRLLGLVLPGAAVVGDNHVFVLRPEC